MTDSNKASEGTSARDDGLDTMTDKSSHETDLESGDGTVPPSSEDGTATSAPDRAVVSSPCTGAFAYKATKAPKETLQALYKAGEYKAGLPLNLLMTQSFMAGIYIAMAGQLFLTVGGGLLGSALFPTGLIAVVLTSAELFTGDALVFVAGVLGGKVSGRMLLRNWTVSWVMNFLGCLFWASLMGYASGALQDAGQVELAIKVAEKKVHQPWGQIFLKGVGANFMVCVGVWQATCAEEVAGKVLGIWFPIAAFVMMGFDHCIANQFFIPMGMMFGADISVATLFWALLPATIGNAVGGGLMVGAVYWYVYDSMASSKRLFTRILDNLVGRRRLRNVTASNDGAAPSHDQQRQEAKDQ